MDTEGNTGRKQAKASTTVTERVAPWHNSEHGDRGRGVTWADSPADDLVALVDAVTRTGAAISLSSTRDRRSVSITILDGPDKPKFYAATREELDSLIRRLLGG